MGRKFSGLFMAAAAGVIGATILSAPSAQAASNAISETEIATNILKDNRFLRIGAPMAEHEKELYKKGYRDFCKKFKAQCGYLPTSLEVANYDDFNRDIIEGVNQAVNEMTVYTKDEDQFKELEHWTVAKSMGDCEDYALDKKRMLIQKGIPASAIMIAYVETKQDNLGHVILFIRTNKGDIALDNRFGKVMTLNEVAEQYNIIAVTNPADDKLWSEVSVPKQPTSALVLNVGGRKTPFVDEAGTFWFQRQTKIIPGPRPSE